MAIKKVKLNYESVVPKVPPVKQIALPSGYMDKLGRSIKQKVRQNEAERAASMEVSGRYMVR